MKGRGTRTLDHDDLRKVTPSAATAKTHYVIVDAIGVTKSLKNSVAERNCRPRSYSTRYFHHFENEQRDLCRW
jgi:type I site-specific restriction endonuclease